MTAMATGHSGSAMYCFEFNITRLDGNFLSKIEIKKFRYSKELQPPWV